MDYIQYINRENKLKTKEIFFFDYQFTISDIIEDFYIVAVFIDSVRKDKITLSPTSYEMECNLNDLTSFVNLDFVNQTEFYLANETVYISINELSLNEHYGLVAPFYHPIVLNFQNKNISGLSFFKSGADNVNGYVSLITTNNNEGGFDLTNQRTFPLIGSSNILGVIDSVSYFEYDSLQIAFNWSNMIGKNLIFDLLIDKSYNLFCPKSEEGFIYKGFYKNTHYFEIITETAEKFYIYVSYKTTPFIPVGG